jgi:hypothetical protein
MRIWSLHPKYLDTKGLIALWRETLLAKHVLEGKTKGYTRHPQLTRFRNTDNPVQAINQYLSIVYMEAEKRAFRFDRTKIDWQFSSIELKVTQGQMEFEKKHLLKKLKIRDLSRFNKLLEETEILPHPLFHVIEGEIEEWEKIDLLL